jgi:hypothetical protein
VKQTVVVDKPPVYEKCVAAFGAETIVGKPILWSWGDKIYNPMDVDIPRELLAHEAVHGARQGFTDAQILDWWGHYLSSPAARLEEEILAHREEWRTYRRRNVGRDCGAMLEAIAERLASPLYGKLITRDGARFAILARG